LVPNLEAAPPRFTYGVESTTLVLVAFIRQWRIVDCAFRGDANLHQGH
jgi:hypothetical protein